MKRGHRLIQGAVLGVCLVLVVGLASCGGGGGGIQTTASGLVRDASTGGPVAGATVVVGTSSAVTDGAGAYTASKVPEGPQTIQCAAGGYQSFPAPGSGPVQILIVEGPNAVQTILLVPSGGGPPPPPP
jgi:hypothetical protein